MNPTSAALPTVKQAPEPYLSVVIPVFNEEDNLEELGQRLLGTLTRDGRPFEIILVDDGSTDRSWEIITALHERHPEVIRAIQFHRNFGQHAAVFAGLAAAQGQVVVTLDADLQNPPEEIPKLLARIDEGYEVVGGWREERHDPWFRRLASRAVNRMTSLAVGVPMRDYGCMLRAYRRSVVSQILDCDERSSFIPALANSLARRTIEIEVAHSDRFGGRSKYGLLKLMRLTFDLLTGFSLVPIQVVSVAGLGVALAGVGFGAFLFVRRLFVGPEVEGVFTLFAILFVFIGLLILAVGIVGEYVGRIYLEVRRRPTYRVRAVHRQPR